MMRFLALLTAPSMALASAAHAFGDMDCVSMEMCRGDACGAEVLPMTLRFDWPNQTIAMSMLNVDDVLQMEPQSEGTALSFATETSRLTLDYTGADILATYTRETDDLWISAQCERIQAA